jgi:xylulokinase
LAHNRKHLFRAVLEGVAYGIRHNIETFQAIGSAVTRVVAVGGGAQTATWPQIVSDVAGMSQTVPAVTLGASFGDAFLAGLAAGILELADLSTWVKPGQEIAPDPDAHETYEPLYADFLELYVATRNIVHRLAGR